MKVHQGFDGLNLPRTVITTGSFDGVHVGHKVILSHLVQRAKDHDAESVLITFYPHPRKILYPEAAGKELRMINTQIEKVVALRETGIDHLVIVEFTLDFSKTSALDFVEQFLVKQLKACHVIIGFNHHFGHNRAGDLEQLQSMGQVNGFTVEEIPEQDIQNESVSSTKIRKSVEEGYIQRANAYLDRPYSLFAFDRNLIHTTGLWHISTNDNEKLLPPPGTYAASVSINNQRVKGIIWVGKKADSDELWFYADVIQPALLKWPTKIDFHKRLHDWPFPSAPDQESINTDLEAIRELIY